jgi:hypothetical protein
LGQAGRAAIERANANAAATLNCRFVMWIAIRLVPNRYYSFGDGRALQVVKEQDAGHDPGVELQTGQNITVQAHPHFPLHTLPLNVWPVATVAIVGR